MVYSTDKCWHMAAVFPSLSSTNELRWVHHWISLCPWEWLASNFSVQYQSWIKCKGHENKRNDHKLRGVLLGRGSFLKSKVYHEDPSASCGNWRLCRFVNTSEKMIFSDQKIELRQVSNPGLLRWAPLPTERRSSTSRARKILMGRHSREEIFTQPICNDHLFTCSSTADQNVIYRFHFTAADLHLH